VKGDRGYRAIGTFHDLGDRTHEVVVDFPTDGATLDAYRTAWSPHVFRDSFRTHPHPEMVYDHRTGTANVIGEAVRAESLSDRARIVGQFEDFDRKPRAGQAFREIKDGTLPGFSFYFTDARGHPFRSRGRRGARYTRARLEDFGPVKHPSIPGAVAVGIRADLLTRPGWQRGLLPFELEMIGEMSDRQIDVLLDHLQGPDPLTLSRSRAVRREEGRRAAVAIVAEKRAEERSGLRQLAYDSAEPGDAIRYIEDVLARARQRRGGL
jgi:phage head maturation protease